MGGVGDLTGGPEDRQGTGLEGKPEPPVTPTHLASSNETGALHSSPSSSPHGLCSLRQNNFPL